MTAPSRVDRALLAGLVTLVALVPLGSGGATYLPATLMRVGAIGLAGFWLWHATRAGAWRRPTPVDLPVMLFLVLAAVSTLNSADTHQSLQGFLTLASGALLLAVGAEVARRPQAARWLATAIATAGLGQALLAIGQYVAGSAGRPAGTYVNPNFLAMVLGMTGTLLLAAEPRGRVAHAGRWLAFGLVVLALLMTGSRGGVIAAGAAWGLVGWMRWRVRTAVAAVLAATALVVVPNPLADRVRSLGERDPRAYARIQIWASAVDRALDHPVGVGLNMFRQTSQRYTFPMEGDVARYWRRPESAHNDYLELLAELGPVGLLLAIWTLAALAGAARQAYRQADGARRATLLGSAGALTVLAVQATVDAPLSAPGLVVQAAVLGGVVLGADRGDRSAELMPAWLRAKGPRAALLAASVLVALSLTRHAGADVAYRTALARSDTAGSPEALRWLAWAERLAPDNPKYAEAFGLASLAAWRVSHDPRLAVMSEQALLRAIARDPQSALRRARLASLYVEVPLADVEQRRRTLERAANLFAEAERLDPYAANYPYDRSDVLLRLGDAEGARAALQRAIDLEPLFLPARLRLARLLVAEGEREAALAQYAAIEQALAEHGDKEARGGYMRIFLKVDREAVRREAEAVTRGRS